MRANKNGRLKAALTLLRIAPLIVFLCLWEIAARRIERGVFYYGSPSSVAELLLAKLADGSLIRHTWVTLYEVIVGFFFGNVIGIIAGLALCYRPGISQIMRPYIFLVGSIPILALAPIMVIWFGIGLFAKIVIVALSTVVVATVQAFEGGINTSPDLIELLNSQGASRFTTFRKVVVPSSFLWLFAGLKLNVGFAILGACVGEFIASDAGLGHMIFESMGLFNTPALLVGVVMICFISILLTTVVGILQRKVMPWRFKRGEHDFYGEAF